jgi:hypothetical protein
VRERTAQPRMSVVAPAVAIRADVTAGEDGYPRRWLMLPVILIATFMAGFEDRCRS